jgi:hypothetical protein
MLVEWITTNQAALTMIGAAVAAIATAAWAVYRYFDEKKADDKKTKAPASQTYQTVQIYGIPFAEYEAALHRREEEVRAQLSKASEAGTGLVEELERQLADLTAELDRRKQRIESLTALVNDIRSDLVPRELDSDCFPQSLSVRSFVKGKELTVNVLPDRVAAVVLRVLGALWTLALSSALVHLFRLPPLLGIPVFALIFYFAFVKFYVRFNFRKKKIDLIGPGSAVWGRTPHPVEVVARKVEGGWQGEVRVEGLRIALTTPKGSEEEARAELLAFARMLNFALGIPVLSLDWVKSPLARKQPDSPDPTKDLSPLPPQAQGGGDASLPHGLA